MDAKIRGQKYKKWGSHTLKVPLALSRPRKMCKGKTSSMTVEEHHR